MAPSAKASGQPSSGHDGVGDRRHHDHRRQDQADGQAQDRLEIGFEVAPGGEERADVEQRRQEDQEDDLGREDDVRVDRDEADDQTAEHECDGVRDGEASGEDAQQRHRDHQAEDELYFSHGAVSFRAKQCHPSEACHPERSVSS